LFILASLVFNEEHLNNAAESIFDLSQRYPLAAISGTGPTLHTFLATMRDGIDRVLIALTRQDAEGLMKPAWASGLDAF
jgi:hypothetical protein